MSRLYGERYLALIDDIMENPPEETPGWHSSELETSQVMAHDESLVRMDRAVSQVPSGRPRSRTRSSRSDGAPDVAFQGYEFFLFATDHQEFTPSGVIGNPFRSTAEKGERTYERYAEHLAAALAEFEKLRRRGPHARVAGARLTVHNRRLRQEETAMKVAMHNWMRAEPVETTIRRLAKYGYDGIEISYDSVELSPGASGHRGDPRDAGRERASSASARSR